ncbi:hypothetical protein TNCV_4186701 [Trichonephila clavipes]|nr:hypothetical protein TNCV_4186701 [Trichonephila clavipes]
MLVRLSRAPVLSGGLRRKTQLFSCTSTWPPPPRPHLTSPQVLKSSKPAQVPDFPGSSPLCHHTKSEKTSDTTSFHSVLVCHRTSWQKNKDNKLNTKKSRIEHKSNKIKTLKEIEANQMKRT